MVPNDFWMKYLIHAPCHYHRYATDNTSERDELDMEYVDNSPSNERQGDIPVVNIIGNPFAVLFSLETWHMQLHCGFCQR